MCAPGKFSLENNPECTVCGDGAVTPFNASTSCISCEDNSRPSFDKTVCDCDRGFYLPDHLGEAIECQESPVGGNCEEQGTKFSNIAASPGWWR